MEDIEIRCPHCGKLLSVTNKYGMFCEDLCGYDESVKAAKKAKKLIGDMMNILKF